MYLLRDECAKAGLRMKRSVLAIAGIISLIFGALKVESGCNAPNNIQVSLTLNGPEYVGIGSTNVYSLVFSPSSVDTNGGAFAWTHIGFTAVGSAINGTIQLIAPEEPSASEANKRTIRCEFSKAGWSSATECSASKNVTVLSLNLMSPVATNYHMAMSPPAMPTILLQVSVTPALSGTDYRYRIGNLASNGVALLYEDAPSSGYVHPGTIDSGWGSVSTNIDFGDNIYGGHVTNVTVSLRKGGREIYTQSFRREFYIVGDSLMTTTWNGYINALPNNANVRAITRVIAMQESGGTHFWPGSGMGTASHTRYPLKENTGPGGGYGIMQLTAANLLNRSTIWNWQGNIDSGVTEIEGRYSAAASFLNTHPNGVTDEMIRLEVYHRYNGGPNSRHYWWTGTQWSTYGYVDCPGEWGMKTTAVPMGIGIIIMTELRIPMGIRTIYPE